jgi:hypothetical protein
LRIANVSLTGDNVPNSAVANFVALQEIFPDLKGLALFDHLPDLKPNPRLDILCWQKRELENYFAKPDLLLRFAKMLTYQHEHITSPEFEKTMLEVIEDYTLRAYLKDLEHDWWNKAKLSDEWLDLIFPEFYKRSNLPVDFYKRDYYKLISLMNVEDIPSEIAEKLDRIYDLLR